MSPFKGYVITGITDVHWEVNGVLDMWRNEKVYAHDLSMIQTAGSGRVQVAHALPRKRSERFHSHVYRSSCEGRVFDGQQVGGPAVTFSSLLAQNPVRCCRSRKFNSRHPSRIP